jgi:hypothetical protein
MIVINDPNLLEENFKHLLENTKTNSLRELAVIGEQARKFKGEDFETLVFKNSLKAAKNTGFEGRIEKAPSPHAFPDIVAKKFYGIEVKMTKDDKWVSTGNSVLETTRVVGVERIYLFFGKLGGAMDIKYRPYQECLFDIGVTHSPRYRINMILSPGHSIFDKMRTDYSVFRKEKNPITIIKDYYRGLLKEGEELWWMDQQADERVVNPIIAPFNTLKKETQDRYITEAMILFPEIFGVSNAKYGRAAAYLVTAYNTVSANLRDQFTSGGKETFLVKGRQIRPPKVFYNLLSMAKSVHQVIEEIDEGKLLYYWRVNSLPGRRIDTWKKLLNKHALWTEAGLRASDIYEWGLAEA